MLYRGHGAPSSPSLRGANGTAAAEDASAHVHLVDKLLVLILVEHLMILAKVGLAWLVPDTPTWVEERRDALHRQGLDLQSHMQSKHEERQQKPLAGAAVAVEVERLRKENAGLKRLLQRQHGAQQERRQDGNAQGGAKPAPAPGAAGRSEDADAVRKL